MQKHNAKELSPLFFEPSHPTHFLLLIFLVAKMLLLCLLVYGLGICLTPDEAQYWTWSQLLDWGYYSKPPAIAWQIRVSTALFGNTELGVRFLSGLLGIGLGWAVYRLAKICQLRKEIAFWSALWMALIPAGWLGSLFAITDGGVVLFWTIACQEVAQALQERRPMIPLRLGGALCIAGLFKWVAFFFWPLLLGFFGIRWKKTAFLRRRSLFFAVCIACLALVPSLFWSINHEWATFLHVHATLQGGYGGNSGNFWEFFGAQLLLVTPLLFGFFGMALYRLWGRWKEESLECSFLFWMGSVGLLAALLLAMRQKMQGNWVIFAYPPLVILAVREMFFRLRRPLKWHVRGSVVTCGVVMGALILPILGSLPEKFQPFKQALSWQEMGPLLEHRGYRPQEHFLVADTYQTSSLLSFYAPGKKRAYFLNLQNIRNNQFSYWPRLEEEQLGKSGYFVRVGHLKKDPDLAHTYLRLLQPYFSQVSFVGVYPLWPYGEESRHVFLFRCEGVLPVLPPASSLF